MFGLSVFRMVSVPSRAPLSGRQLTPSRQCRSGLTSAHSMERRTFGDVISLCSRAPLLPEHAWGGL